MKRLQEILLNYKETPPEKNWEKISTRLDDQDLRNRLLQYHTAPSADIWSRISTGLDQQKTGTPVIPINRYKLKTYWAVAAVLLMVLSASVLYFTSEQSNKASTAAVPQHQSQDQKSEAPPMQQNEDEQEHIAGNRPSHFRATVSKQPAEKVLNKKIPADPDGKKDGSAFVSSLSDAHLLQNIKEKIRLLDLSSFDRYMVVQNEHTYARVSRRVFEELNCTAEDLLCKTRLRELQQTVSMASSNSGFSGFIEVVKQLQENQ